MTLTSLPTAPRASVLNPFASSMMPRDARVVTPLKRFRREYSERLDCVAGKLLSSLPTAAGGFAIAVGVAVLAGWAVNLEALKGAGSRITMKPNAAVCIIACGISLLRRRGPAGRWRRVPAYVAGLATALMQLMYFALRVAGMGGRRR